METSIPVSPTPTFRIHKDHPKSQIIGPIDTPVQTRYKSKDMEEQSFIVTIHQKANPELLQFCLFSCFLSQEEPKKIFDAHKDPSWVEAMQEELLQFKIQNVWVLVDLYQIDVKSAFLYGTIDEEPLGFQDPEFPKRVYRVEKAMYGLYQAPRALKHKGEFLLVQVYVDDIIFGSSNPQLCREFEALMHDKFQMSAMGELTFFLGLQVLEKKDGIFLSQDKYVGDILKKFGYFDVRLANTPMDKENPWRKDGPGKDVELHIYRSMIGSLMYLTTSRPDIMFTTIVATSTTDAEYVAAASGCGQVLWIKKSDAGLWMSLYLFQEMTDTEIPTVSSLDARQDRENIAKTFAMSHESSPRVPSLDADEGSMQQRLHELMELCTSLQRQQSQMADKIKDQDIKISGLKARVKSLEDKEKRRKEPIQEDAPITGGIIDIGEELGADKSTEKGSNDTEEMVNVLSSMQAANILSSGGATTASVSPADVFLTAGVPTVSGSFPTISAIFTTASVVTPYTRRLRGITIGSLWPMRIPIISAKDKGKKKVTKTEVPKKKKLQEQIDAQVAREMEEEFARENQRLSEQVVRDSKIARIHVEEELKLMIEGLDRSNEVIAKHLSEYEQAEANLSVKEKIELISELVKYQDHLAEILKYQAQQSKPSSKKE
uniref:Reverse transcriptase Ty1/copia-type domain-containing protein n=1 Tax=Tanacetum cinerariifolium TaxID=118510 RepID=A0A6L2L7K2_TANCI|nr:hypothetical protein [Tanacetum cinerariifolium]